jgi:hypothetical protein
MDVGAGVRLVTLGVSFALLACDETTPEPTYNFPTLGGASGSGGSSGSAAGVSEPMCITDAQTAPVPSALEGDITARVMSDGCGKPYPCEATAGRCGEYSSICDNRTLLTEGEKAPNCASGPRCGAWSMRRSFRVVLPGAYDPQQPYALVIHGDGCGSSGYEGVFSPPNSFNVPIHVGVVPALPTEYGPGFDCFDDQEGDDSLDWVFYERLYDKLNAELCFDRRRVFVSGHASAFANELACKYAGDAVRPVRGVLVNNGTFPAEPGRLPTCSQAPLSGIWVHELDGYYDPPFDNAKRAVTRAMAVGQCPGGDYDHAQKESFQIGFGTEAFVCERIVGCSPLYPLIVCPLSTTSRNHLDVADPAFETFVRQFTLPPLLPVQ